jgi:hypothetical protein
MVSVVGRLGETARLELFFRELYQMTDREASAELAPSIHLVLLYQKDVDVLEKQDKGDVLYVIVDRKL